MYKVILTLNTVLILLMVSCANKQVFYEGGHLFGVKIIDVDTETIMTTSIRLYTFTEEF